MTLTPLSKDKLMVLHTALIFTIIVGVLMVAIGSLIGLGLTVYLSLVLQTSVWVALAKGAVVWVLAIIVGGHISLIAAYLNEIVVGKIREINKAEAEAKALKKEKE